MKMTPSATHLRYIGKYRGPTRGSLGDPQLGDGVAVRRLPDGNLRLYLGSKNPTQVLQADMPPSLGPTAVQPLTSVKAIGSMPCEWFIKGLYWDEMSQRLYQTCHSEYDGDPATSPTLTRGVIGADGKLTSEGRWAFANRSDKMTDGGVTALPDGSLGVGFGGYRSMVAVGPASMGLALASFQRPSVASPITCKPLVGYPYSAKFVPRMRRSANDYVNDIGADALYPANLGLTTWADWATQNAVWIETPGLSGLLSVWLRATGRVWYTNTVNAAGWRYDLVSYNASILNGPQSAAQPEVDVPFSFQGAPINGPHADSPAHPISGLTYEPVSRTLIMGVRGMFGADATLATGYVVFQVVDPVVKYRLDRTLTQNQRASVEATSADEAAAQADTAAWQPVSNEYSPVTVEPEE